MIYQKNVSLVKKHQFQLVSPLVFIPELIKNKKERDLALSQTVHKFEEKRVCLRFFQRTFQLMSETRSLSADWPPSFLTASGCGVSASQIFGRSVTAFFHPTRVHKTIKNHIELVYLQFF
jgi:hypothetical protein